MAEKISLAKGPGGTIHARVSVVAVWQKLEALDALANETLSRGVRVDPAKVKEWREQFWRELGGCKDTYITYR